MEELKYRKEVKQFIEDRGFSGIANQTEIEALMSLFVHKIALDWGLANVIKRHVCIVDENKASKEVYICGICEMPMDLDVF